MTTVRSTIFGFLIAAVAASAAVDPILLNLVMPDAKFVSGIQVESSRNSPFGRYVLSQIEMNDPGFTRFITTTGFDPRRDLAEVVAGTSGTSADPATLVLGRGTFSPAVILAAAKAHGATVSAYGAIDIITMTHPGATTAGGLAFLNGSYAAMGTLDAVKGAIDRYKSPAGSPSVFSSRAQTLSDNNDAWFLSTGPVTDFFTGKIADPNLGGALKGNLLQAVLQADGGVKFGDNVTISGQALTRSDKDAAALADVVRFLAGMVQMNSGSDPSAKKLASLLDTLTLTTPGATMQLSLSIPESTVEQLFMPGGTNGPKARMKRAALR